MNAMLLRILSLARERTLAAVLNVPEEYMALQPAGARNHPAWTLGHLLFVEAQGARALGLDPELPEGWAGRYAPGSTPTSARAAYAPKQELLERLGGLRIALLDRFASMPDASLDRPTPAVVSPFLGHCATIGDVLLYLAWHEGYHNGQLAVWRHAAGLGR
jgi:hypothetical protein